MEDQRRHWSRRNQMCVFLKRCTPREVREELRLGALDFKL